MLTIIAIHIAYVQMIPASALIGMQRLWIDQDQFGVPYAHALRHTRYDTDVIVILEIHPAADRGQQVCNGEVRLLAESLEKNEASARLRDLFPRCPLGALAGERLIMEATYLLDLDYGIRKRLVVPSEPFVLKLGPGLL